MRYGLPYQGSKNKLAKRIVDLLPPAEHLYDVFAGGCAVSHAAILSGKFGCVHFSDTNDAVTLFRDALEGNIPDGSEWISREEFFRRKDTDPYVRIVWSFGNNQRGYLYGRDIEPYKKAVHEMIFAPTPNERRLKYKEVCKLIPLTFKDFVNGGEEKDVRPCERRTLREAAYRLQPAECQLPPPINATKPSNGTLPESACRMEHHERRITPPISVRCASCGSRAADLWRTEPYRLQAEERRQQLELPFCFGEYEMRVADYHDIEILPNSIIYADPPYRGTKKYMGADFDHEAFYDWCEQQTAPLYISEYWMPEDRFKCIAEFKRTSSFSATNNAKKEIERIYRPIKQIEI